MRVTIIKDDDMVYVDGLPLRVDCSTFILIEPNWSNVLVPRNRLPRNGRSFNGNGPSHARTCGWTGPKLFASWRTTSWL